MKYSLQQPDNNERIGRLETAVEGIQSEFGEIRQTLSDIQRTLGKSKETNWSVVFAGLAIVGSLYGTAIRPLENRIDEEHTHAKDISDALLKQSEKFSGIESSIVQLQSASADSAQHIKEIYERGSPITDKRLSLLEWRLEQPKP